MIPALDHTLRQFSGYNIKRAFGVIQSDVNNALRPFGLRMLSYSVLSVITGQAGVRQSQLADTLAMERPNIVQLIDELEQAGWITRNRDPDDRRAWVLTSTPEGRRLCKQATKAIQDHEARLTHGLTTSEKSALIAALRRIELNGQHGGTDGKTTLLAP